MEEMESQAVKLKELISDFPLSPGVYMMKDSQGRIIYIGKAKELKKRVSSYFTGEKDLKTRILVRKIGTIEYIITENEYEALILENNLIKKWKPHYNVNLKDGKSYPVIRITKEAFPRIYKTRHIVHDGSEYYGPYADVNQIDAFLELMEKLYPLRKCRGPLKKRYTPCLYYHIGRCSAPCAGKISEEAYNGHVDSVRKLLKGHNREMKDVISRLQREMEEAAEDLNFERAAEVRDSIGVIEGTRKLQQDVEDFNLHVRDYIACVMREHIVSISVLQMREGKILGREIHRAESFGTEQDALINFFLQYYQDPEDIPEQIFVSHSVDTEILQRVFDELLNSVKTGRTADGPVSDADNAVGKKRSARKVRIKKPNSGKHYRIMRMALENAVMDAEKRLKSHENIPGLEELQKVLGLRKLPKRIEGFDIAQLAGKYPAASLISFYNGNPDKKNYRRFHVKKLEGRIDDYEAIREVVARRYTKIINEKLKLPDLVLIDGGKGQVSAAKEILDALGLDDLPVAGLAKEFEEIHLPAADENPIRLPRSSEALKILQAVRDETHRFATAFNQQLRTKDSKFSLLESVPGIGPKRSRELMKSYGSLQNILKAGPEAVHDSCGVPLDTAQALIMKLSLEISKP